MNCNRCGSCCKTLAIPTKMFTKEILAFYVLRGLEIDGDWVLFPQKCQYFEEPNICLIHCSKPRVCREFHGQKKMSGRVMIYVPKGCVYR